MQHMARWHLDCQTPSKSDCIKMTGSLHSSIIIIYVNINLPSEA